MQLWTLGRVTARDGVLLIRGWAARPVPASCATTEAVASWCLLTEQATEIARRLRRAVRHIRTVPASVHARIADDTGDAHGDAYDGDDGRHGEEVDVVEKEKDENEDEEADGRRLVLVVRRNAGCPQDPDAGTLHSARVGSVRGDRGLSVRGRSDSQFPTHDAGGARG
jgi:hypothetical protein